MTNMLRRMGGSGLIIRLPDASDTRISRVYLTDTGKIALDKATHLADQMGEITFAGLTTAELATLTNLLGCIHINLNGQSFA